MNKVIHKEYALRRFYELSLKHKYSKSLLERLWVEPNILSRLVFVTNREHLPNTMVIAEAGADSPGFELRLNGESDYLSLVNGTLVQERRQTKQILIRDPLKAWDTLQDFLGLLHVHLVFSQQVPDWYHEVAVPNEAVPNTPGTPGFAAFVREQIDLILWGITLKEQIDQALLHRDEALFHEAVRLYKKVCQSCFWQLS